MNQIIIIFLTMLLIEPLSAQQSKAVAVGQKLPQIEVKNVTGYSKKNVRLSDFKGKVVIIHFWGTYCAPCIETLFKLDSLQKKYKEGIQVITVTQNDSEDKVKYILKKLSKGRSFQLPVVIGDKDLQTYFPYQLISHIVWIDKNAVVRGITGSEYVTESNLLSIMNGEKINWPVKKDGIGYDNNKPFLAFSQKEITSPSFIYSSAFTGSMQNIAPPQGRLEDTIQRTATFNFYNYSLLSLCKVAIDFRSDANLDEFKLTVRDSSRYFNNKGEFNSTWVSRNTYCYSTTLPITITPKEMETIVKADLKRWLSILGITVEKEDGKYVVTEKALK